jgi:CheY-like chemotaxis protein
MIAWSPPDLFSHCRPPSPPNGRRLDSFGVQRIVKNHADAFNGLLTGDTYFSKETKSNFLSSIPRVNALRGGRVAMDRSRSRAPRVLLVEDEVLISMMIEDAMVARGFEVYTATNAGDALQVLSEGPPVDVLFTDINIEGDMDGAALARRARELHPELAVLYASGSMKSVANAVPGSTFVPKPYALADVCKMVAQMASD